MKLDGIGIELGIFESLASAVVGVYKTQFAALYARRDNFVPVVLTGNIHPAGIEVLTG